MLRRRRPPRGSGVARSRQTAPDSGGDDQERLILAALQELRGTTVREVMTPRVDVVGLAIPVAAADVTRAVRTSGHSVFPVYDDDLDHLIGILYVNDLFRAGWEPESYNGEDEPNEVKLTPLDISRRLRTPYMVPESRFVLDVLSDMRRDGRAFAVVVDEYGGVAGVLTVKDLLSALVGDLHDEFDGSRVPDIVRVDRSRWLVDGSTSLDDVREELHLDLPEGEYVTLGGFLFDAFGHIPDEGERLGYDGWELRVAEMDRRRVAKVVVQENEDGELDEGDILPGDGL